VGLPRKYIVYTVEMGFTGFFVTTTLLIPLVGYLVVYFVVAVLFGFEKH